MSARGAPGRQKNDKTKGSSSSTCSGKGSIQSFFNGTAKVKKRTVVCPVCTVDVELIKINEHMDSRECQEKSSKLVEEKTEVIKSSGLKRSLVESVPDAQRDKKKLKPNSDVDVVNDLVNSEELLKTPEKKKISLSRQISYNPNKFGGEKCLHEMSLNKKLIKSPTKSVGEKYRRTPTKEKREQIDSSRPALPQHDPFTPSKRSNPEYVPYYVRNFQYVLSCVIDCTSDKNLFTDSELDIIDSYRELPLDSKKLFVRLLNRKHAWISLEKVKYDEIQSVEIAMRTLVKQRLVADQGELNDVEELLNHLQASDVKLIAKEINCASKATGKAEITGEILKLCRRKSVFFQSVNTLERKVVTRAKSLMSASYKIVAEVRSTLMRVLCLWGLSTWWESREEGAAPTTLTNILLTNQGRVTYPSYNIIRQANIFRNREDLVAFEEAMKMEENIEHLLQSKQFEAAYESHLVIIEKFDKLDQSFFEHVKSLPVFLQKYTTLSVIIVALNKAVDLLEKMKKYTEAVKLLKRLLGLNVLAKFRGHWYERLSLDLDSHLKLPEEALEVVETALADERVRGGRRLLLNQRAVKICSSKRNRLESRLEKFTESPDWESPSGEDLPSTNIKGRMLRQEGKTGKSVWQICPAGGEGETTYCSVEEFCMNHFTSDGSTQALHAEGAIFNSLLGLLFWEVIYDVEVPDAFRDPCQSLPYDWDTDHFYAARRTEIEVRLAELRSLEREELAEEVGSRWARHQDTLSLVNWSVLSSERMVRQLVLCFDPLGLVSVLGRMVTDHRSTRSGLPDLTLWNSQLGTVRCVEVKGPGDKLSTKQILWIRFLNSAGIPSEVCHVSSLGSKALVE